MLYLHEATALPYPWPVSRDTPQSTLAGQRNELYI